MRKTLAALLFCAAATTTPALASVSVSIGINVPVYPTLQRIPNYPVYYAPSLPANYFFYDGLYWVFDGGRWYASSWYNGPWDLVDPYAVPVYLLRVPVRYYRSAPVTFRSWRIDAPPRWQEYWGPQWSERRYGWDRWDVRSAPAPAPLPAYQRQYSRDRYPALEQQVRIQSRNYRYEPRDQAAREVYRERRGRAEASFGTGPGRSASAPGQQRSQSIDGRGPPDHAVAKGLRERGEDRRGPPDHAVARGVRERDDDRRGPPERVAASRDRDDGRGPPAHAQGKGKDKGNDEGRGRGRDKDKD
jgi:hypothetical protein